MTKPSTSHDSMPTLEPKLDKHSDLETVLAAWHSATVKLEKTHEALQAEVRRLTQELTAKNRELARKNRLADLGQMASHVAHEVRNNLVPVNLYMSLLRRRLSSNAGDLDVLEKIESGVTALDVTVNDLLNFTSDRDPLWQCFDLDPLVREILDGLAPQFMAQGIRMQVEVPERLSISADRSMLRRALLNLVLNAVDAMPEGGEIYVTAIYGHQGIEIEVADSGNGLSEEARRRAFEPFYTTKSTGTGLGLAIVDRVAEAHGGGVTAINCPEGGAAITIRIPQLAMRAAA